MAELTFIPAWIKLVGILSKRVNGILFLPFFFFYTFFLYTYFLDLNEKSNKKKAQQEQLKAYFLQKQVEGFLISSYHNSK